MAEKNLTSPGGMVHGRIEWMDSLKGTLIFLVVLGHVLLPLQQMKPYISGAYELIFLFHMPLFVFVSGFFSKRTIDGDGHLRVDRILTYATLGIAFNAALRLCSGTPVELDRDLFSLILKIPGAPWYLVSLATWQLLVPFFDRLKPVWGMVVAVCVSVVATTVVSPNDVLALSRTGHFLPYFLAGYYLSADALQRLRSPRVRGALILAGIAAAMCYLVFQDQLAELFPLVYGNNSLQLRLSVSIPGYFLMAGFGIALSLGCIALAPSGEGKLGRVLFHPLSALGRRTLQVYIAHRFVREAMSQSTFYDAVASMDQLALFSLLVGISVFICVVLSWSGFTRVLDKVTSLRWRFMLRA